MVKPSSTSANDVKIGGKIVADQAIGVYLMAGNDNGQTQNRWFTLTPDEQWSSSYYAPVSTTVAGNPSGIVLYNPHSTAIEVKFETATQTGTLTVAANSTQGFLMPASAAHFFTEASSSTPAPKFFAAGVTDGNSTSYDWSYALIPESNLTDRAVVGLGWGSNPDSTAGSGRNWSPVWITPVNDTTIYVEGATSLTVKNSAGATVAAEPDGGYKLNRLQSYRFLDSDRDQSGLNFFTKDGTLFTGAWGQDPNGSDGSNALDMGSALTPYPDYIITKTSKEAFGDGDLTISNDNTKVELGEQVEYKVTLENRAVIDLFNIKITDKISPEDSATYVANSLTVTVYRPDGTKGWSINQNTQTFYKVDGTVEKTVTLSPGDSMDLSGETFKLESGFVVTDIDPSTLEKDGLKRGGRVEFTYRVQARSDIDKAFADENLTITNTVKLGGGNDPEKDDEVDKTKEHKTPIDYTLTDGEVLFTDSSGAVVTNYEPGDTIYIKVTDGDQNKNATSIQTLRWPSPTPPLARQKPSP